MATSLCFLSLINPGRLSSCMILVWLFIASWLPSAVLGESTDEVPRVIGTNHVPEKILAELTDPNSIHPGRMLALSLFGALAIVSSSLMGLGPRGASSRRSELNPYQGASSYVKNINNFEKEAYYKLRDGLSKTLRSARIVGRRTSSGLGRAIRGMARAGKHFGYGLDRLGRVLVLGTNSGLRRAIWGAQGFTSRAGGGIRHFLKTYNRGLRRAAYNFGRSAGNGLKFLGVLTSSGVSRMGTVTSFGLSRIGGLAASSAIAIFNTALNVPLSLAVAAKERAVQDCLIQTVCYISTPILTSRRRRRRKRMIDENEYRNSTEDLRGLTSRRVDDGEFRMEDCEIFECRLASLGRKAFGVFSKIRNKDSAETP